MVYYKDNPKIKGLQIVTTVNGENEYRKNCRYINEKYYVINKSCFYIDEKWRRIDDPDIIYDWESKSYISKRKYQNRINKGIVRNEKGQLEIGFFVKNPYNNVMTVSNAYGNIVAISAEALGKEWQEDLRYHHWFLTTELTSSQIASKKVIKNNDNPAARGYNIEDNPDDFLLKKRLYENYKPYITKQIKSLSKYVGDISFGFEFELAQGFLPDHLQNRFGVVPVRDGSLNGGSELTTVPMSGAKGLQTIIDLADALRERGQISLDCSLHIHFGNIGNDKLSVIALYRLCRSIQDELFSMFPYYKTDPSGIKQKNYTKKLHKLNINSLKDLSKNAYETYLVDSYNKLFNYYSERTISLDKFNKKTREHPITNKWSRPSRLTQ